METPALLVQLCGMCSFDHFKVMLLSTVVLASSQVYTGAVMQLPSPPHCRPLRPGVAARGESVRV